MKTGCMVRHVAFPDYQTSLGKEIRKFLLGKITLCPEVRQLLYVANRWERKTDMEGWLQHGLFVIADRYSPSGLVYGLANKLNLDWMLTLEEGLPPADLVIVIDISIETSYARDKKKDLYENDLLFLGVVRASYLDLANKFGWVVINGEQSENAVFQEIRKRVTSCFHLM